MSMTVVQFPLTLHSLIQQSPSHPLSQVQGMSSIAAVLILNMDEIEAFVSFSNLMNRPCQLAFYRVDHQLVNNTHTTNKQTNKQKTPTQIIMKCNLMF